MNAPAVTTDPSRTSHYVNDALYRALIENFSNWQDDARAVIDVAVRDEFRRLIEREARLLDQLLRLARVCGRMHLLGADAAPDRGARFR